LHLRSPNSQRESFSVSKATATSACSWRAQECTRPAKMDLPPRRSCSPVCLHPLRRLRPAPPGRTGPKQRKCEMTGTKVERDISDTGKVVSAGVGGTIGQDVGEGRGDVIVSSTDRGSIGSTAGTHEGHAPPGGGPGEFASTEQRGHLELKDPFL